MWDKGLWKSISGASGAKILSLGISMVSVAVTARWLGPEGRGQIVAITTWIGLVAAIAHLSLGQVALHRAAGAKDTRWLGPALGSLGLVTFAVSALGWLVLLVLWFATHGKIFGGIAPYLLVAGFAALPFYIWESYGSYLLMAMDRLSVYNRAQVAGRIASLPLLLLLLPVMALGAFGGLLAVNFGQVVTSCFGMRKLARLSETRIRPARKVLKDYLGGGVKLHFNAIGTVLFTSTEVVIIQAYLGAKDTGTYQLAQQLASMLLLIPAAAGMVIYSKVGSQGPDGFWPGHKKLMWQMMGLMLLAMVGTAVAAPLIIPLLAGKKFVASIPILQIMLLTIPGKALSQLMAPQWIGRGLFVQASLVTFGVGCLSLAGNLIFTSRFGIRGVLAVSIVTYAISLAVNLGMAFWVEKRFHGRVA